MYYKEGFFNKDIKEYDPFLSNIINKELERQQNHP